MPAHLDCGKLLFADDLKIFSKISEPSDCAYLQRQLQNLQEWCENNRLALNIDKCSTMSFTRKASTIQYRYHINRAELGQCENIRDLGVTFDSRLTFTNHIRNITSSSLKTLGFIIRNTRSFSSIDAIMLLYFSYVRSKLEYCSLVWSPFYKVHSTEIERVQRRFLKYLYFRLYHTYPERGYDHNILLHVFNIQSLEHRRHITDMKFLYNLMNHNIDASELNAKSANYATMAFTKSFIVEK